MTAYATKEDVQIIVNKAVTDLSEIIASFATQVDERFNRVEERLTCVETRLTGVEARLERIEKRSYEHDEKFERLFVLFDLYLGREERHKTEQLLQKNAALKERAPG